LPIPTKEIAEIAKRGLRERQKYVDDGVRAPATPVGIARANQLANRENISMETINRMISFLERHEKNYNPGKRDSKGRLTKGTVSYLLWGGPQALQWAKREKIKAMVKS
jgi:hypothetical protein